MVLLECLRMKSSLGLMGHESGAFHEQSCSKLSMAVAISLTTG